MIKKNKVADYEAEIIHLYTNEKWSISQIARHLGFSPPAINRFLRQKVELRKQGFSDEQKQQILHYYEAGYSKREIARRMDTDAPNISRILLYHFGIQPEPAKGAVSPFKDLIPLFIKDYQSGMSASQIASKYNASHNTVLKHLRIHSQAIKSREEVARRNDLSLDYFNELTDEKIYQLGQLWASATIRKKDAPQVVVTVDCAKEHLFYDAIKGLVDASQRRVERTSGNSLVLKIGSISLCKQFEEWGLRKDYPTLLSKNEKLFWEGYFSIKLSIHRQSIYIGIPKAYSSEFHQTLIDYLTEIGITPSAIHYKVNAIVISRKPECQTFINAFPNAFKNFNIEEQYDWCHPLLLAQRA